MKSRFGKKPSGARLERILSSPHYEDGQFQNLRHTPPFGENHSIKSILYERLFKKFPNLKPVDKIPNIKTDLHALDPSKNILIWFGHSSYFLQINGIRILVDPVFSGNASPIPNTVKSFDGANEFSVADMPNIDYLLMTHDHYDHLDFTTICALESKITHVVCGLGVGAHFENWGYSASKITEKEWYENLKIVEGIELFIEPTRHFSGRSFKRNNTLWVSFVLKTDNLTLYLGGDGGYDENYAEIGRKFGPFDLVILENGQYNEAWPYIHKTPEQVLKASLDLNAKRVFPVHSSKFNLSTHSWDDPLKKITALNETFQIPLVTPLIGEVIDLMDEHQVFQKWWEILK